MHLFFIQQHAYTIVIFPCLPSPLLSIQQHTLLGQARDTVSGENEFQGSHDNCSVLGYVWVK